MTSTLVLGDFDLTDPTGFTWGAGVEAEGTTRGAPVPIEVAVKSWLQDGSIVVTQGYDNRELAIRVRLWSPDLAALADAEAALFAEIGKPNLLTWTPPDGLGAPAVFVVVTSSLVHDDAGADLLEAQQRIRVYNIRLICEAFVRSESETITPALAASGTTTTLVNNGSSATGWTSTINGVAATPSVVSGAVKTSSSALKGTVVVSETLTAAITTSSTKYLMVDWKPESSDGSPDLRAFGDGVELTRTASQGLGSGLTRTWFGPVAASSIAVLRLESSSTPRSGLLYNPSLVRSLAIDNINRTDVKPAVGTARQLQRTIAIGGSARAQGNLTIQHETSALGDVFAYVWPSGNPVMDAYCPACKPSRTAGPSVTGDTAMMSGGREVLATGTPTVFTIAANSIPAGVYTAVARMKWTNALATDITLTASATTTINSTQVGPTSSLPGRTYLGGMTSTGWVNTTLGRFSLPAVDLQASSTANVVITLTTVKTGVGGASLELDELWLFGAFGSLIAVSCGTASPAAGGSSNRLFVTAPTVTTPRPTLLVGFTADGTDAHYPAGSVGAWQMPEFTPDAVNIFTATSNALDAAAAFRAANRWHTNPAS